jgi:hypothetical protein
MSRHVCVVVAVVPKWHVPWPLENILDPRVNWTVTFVVFFLLFLAFLLNRSQQERPTRLETTLYYSSSFVSS